jgi:RNA polymerase sigma-70 factor (ECF subfamily)
VTYLNRHTYEQLFRQHYARLYRLAYGFISDEEASKDIVSDVFTNLWSQKEKFDGQRNLSGYLFISVRNQCINYLKRHPHLTMLDELMQASLKEENAEELQQTEELIDELNRELDKMAPKTKAIMRECFYNGRTYREVGQDFGLTPDGIKKHVMKGLALLRQHFRVNKSKKQYP